MVRTQMGLLWKFELTRTWFALEISKSIVAFGQDAAKLPKLNALSAPFSGVKTSAVLTMVKTLNKTWAKVIPLDKNFVRE